MKTKKIAGNRLDVALCEDVNFYNHYHDHRGNYITCTGHLIDDYAVSKGKEKLSRDIHHNHHGHHKH